VLGLPLWSGVSTVLGQDLAADALVEVQNVADTAYRDVLAGVSAMGRNVELGVELTYD